jgi:hypothetical protein
MDRLDIVLGIRPPQRDLPFAELDALYTHILAGVENIETALEILSFLLLGLKSGDRDLGLLDIEKFLALERGDVELFLGDLNSLVNIGPEKRIDILHASLKDFLVDPARSKALWINPRARHTAFTRRFLHLLQLKGKQDHSSDNTPILISTKAISSLFLWLITTSSTISKMRN